MFKEKYVFFQIFIISFYLVMLSEPAKILAALPIPMPSHQMVFRVLLEELAKRGHEVTIITGIPKYTEDKPPPNYIEIDVKDVLEVVRNNLLTNTKLSDDMVTQFSIIYKLSVEVNDKLLGLDVIQNLIHNTDSTYYDLIFIEDCFRSPLILSHFFKAPVINLSSFGGTLETFELVGAETHPLIYPLALGNRYGDLSVWEKFSEMLLLYRLRNKYRQQEMMDNEIFKKYFGNNAPTIDDLKKNISMVFLNIHPVWDSNRPVPPNVIYLGGLHQKLPQDLPKVNSSTNGVIYVSFGTNVDQGILTSEKLQLFINVFSKLPYDVYLKWSDENIPIPSKNIKVQKWFPQSDLLRHPKVKLFITQGGLQSTDEAIASGVPLIGIPMVWDQWYNVYKYEQLKIGIQLNMHSITENKLMETIETVIGDKSYKENIIKLHSVMRDQMQSPLERAVWWTDYVIRHGGSTHLRGASAQVSCLEYYEVKLILCLLSLLVLFLVILSSIIVCILRLCVHKIKTN